jgi:hypothetical protein
MFRWIGSRRLELLGLLIVLVVVLGVYRGAFAGFFEQDDFGWLGDATRFEGFSDYTHSFWRFNAARTYRPLSQETFFLLGIKLFGLWPPGFHGMSVGLHLLGIILVYLLLRTFFPAVPSMVGALFYGVHNAHLRSVYWISAAPEPMALVAYVAGLLAFVRYDRSRRTGYYMLSIAAVLLGIMSKESILSLPLVLVAYCGIFAPRLLFRTLPHLALAALYLLLRLAAAAGASPYQLSFGWITLNHLMTYLSWAAGLSETLVQRIGSPPTATYMLVGTAVASTIGVLIYRSKDKRAAIFALVWFLLALQPVLYFSEQIYGYYLAPALAALSLLITGIISGAMKTGRVKFAIALTATVALSLVTGTTGVRWEGEWWNQRSFLARNILRQMPAVDKQVPPGNRTFIFGFGPEELGTLMNDAAFKCYGYSSPRFIIVGLTPVTPLQIDHWRNTGEILKYHGFVYSEGTLTNRTEDFRKDREFAADMIGHWADAARAAFDAMAENMAARPEVRVVAERTELRAGKDTLVLHVANLHAQAIDVLYLLNGQKMPPVTGWELDRTDTIRTFVDDTASKGDYRFVAIRDSFGKGANPWVPVDLCVTIR